MSINDDIEMLEYIEQDFYGCRQGVALHDAINILQKYQKIENALTEIAEKIDEMGGSNLFKDYSDYSNLMDFINSY